MHMFLSATLIHILFVAFAAAPAPSEKPEPAPIIHREMEFYDFTLKQADGRQFNLRGYAEGRRLVIIGFVAGWCKNSNDNGHVIKRLYDKYKARGLGVVAVAEYSTSQELAVHVNRVGIDYPVVVETEGRGDRKSSVHYKYRRKVGDSRKWGTPFYVIVDTRDIEPAGASRVLARRIHTVSGEIVEEEAERFIESRLN